MEYIIGFIITAFIVVGFFRIENNVAKIAKSVENIEKGMKGKK